MSQSCQLHSIYKIHRDLRQILSKHKFSKCSIQIKTQDMSIHHYPVLKQVNVNCMSTEEASSPLGCFVSSVGLSGSYSIILSDILLSVLLWIENATLNIKLLKKSNEMFKPGQNALVLILSLWNKAFIYCNEIVFEHEINLELYPKFHPNVSICILPQHLFWDRIWNR